MKLGLLTAALPRLSLEKVAAWSAGNGFEMLEVACWPSAGGERRRYAGVSHIDVENLDAAKVRATLDKHGLEISSLAYYPNNLHPDSRDRKAANDHLKKVIDAAAKLGVPTRRHLPRPRQEQERHRQSQGVPEVWPRLVAHAERRGVNIAIENCPMIFSSDEWPGGTNLATTPAVWDEMFSIIPSKRFGLNLDPSHLVWQMIDYERVGARLRARGSSTSMRRTWRSIATASTATAFCPLGMGWQVPRLPGLGEVRWDRFIAALYRVGYDGVISIEHEDRDFERTEALVKRGFLIGRDALRPYLH